MQVVLIALALFAEYLSGYKAGVAQHLYFKKISYISNYYQGIPLFLQSFIMLGVGVFTGVAVSKKGGSITRDLWKFYLLLATLVIWFLSPTTRELNIYAHGLITVQICILLEAARLFVIFRQETSSPTNNF